MLFSYCSSSRMFRGVLVLAGAMLTTAAAAVAPDDPADVSPLLIGAPAPAFSLQTATGAEYTLAPDVLERPVVLTFYRGGWCPYCNAQLMGMRKIEDDLRTLGYDLLFASADSVAQLEDADETPADGYTLLSDSTMQVAQAFGVAYRLDDATYELYKRNGLDLEAVSGHDHHLLPVPAVFLIGTDGSILFSYVNPDYRYRIDPQLLMTAARVVLTQQPLKPLRP
jgi:peroxiredoxin